jgi:hypothetical protein
MSLRYLIVICCLSFLTCGDTQSETAAPSPPPPDAGIDGETGSWQLDQAYDDIPLTDLQETLIRTRNADLLDLTVPEPYTDRPETDIPELKRILERPLSINGTPISEAPHPAAPAGMATCVNGRPVIHFSETPTAYNDLYKYVFFREHEYAHHVLGHVPCPRPEGRHRPSRREIARQELAADSLAAGYILREAGAYGPTVLALVAGGFTGNAESASYVPPLRIRGCRLMGMMGLNGSCE